MFKIHKNRSVITLYLLLFIFISSFSALASSVFQGTENQPISMLYQEIDFKTQEKPEWELFNRAITGYYRIAQSQQLSENEIITIIDFRKSANEKRLWILDIKNKKLLYHTLVAHGRNSGDVFANKFSNIPNSNQSSLGFYITGNTYIGKHGISLILQGVEKGINDQAQSRAIVMHGADYVSESYIKKVGRLGRSFGCPAVPMGIHKEIVSQLAGGTCLFIFYPDQDYLTKTSFTIPSTTEESVAATDGR